MPCPVCTDAPLRKAAYKKVPLLGCERCGGVWATAGRLAAVVRDMRDLPESSTEPTVREKLCPECPVPIPMDERPYADGEALLVDVCQGCHGVWLDGGELKQVLRLHRRLRRQRASADADAVRAVAAVDAARWRASMMSALAHGGIVLGALIGLWLFVGKEIYDLLSGLPKNQALVVGTGIACVVGVGLFYAWLRHDLGGPLGPWDTSIHDLF